MTTTSEKRAQLYASIAVALGVTAVALGFWAVGNSLAPQPEPPAAVETVEPSDDEEFVALLAEFGYPHIDDPVVQSNVHMVGRAVCAALDDGMTLDEVAATMTDATIADEGPEMALLTADAAITAYCPEHR